MTDTKHTALPWHMTNPVDGLAFAATDADHKNYLIGVAYYGKERQLLDTEIIDRETAHANAAFIITACNSHYELLEALKRCTAEIAKESHRLQFVLGAHERSDVLDRLVQEANAALSKAEGKS